LNLDFFDKPAICQKVWNRLLTGVVLDSLEVNQSGPLAQVRNVQRLLDHLRASTWEEAPAISEGQEFRSDADSRTHASTLVFGESVLHGSVVEANRLG
jgi:hypothetical protein